MIRFWYGTWYLFDNIFLFHLAQNVQVGSGSERNIY
jgi:hypothetical protein